jgi:hypothetical protein
MLEMIIEVKLLTAAAVLAYLCVLYLYLGQYRLHRYTVLCVSELRRGLYLIQILAV